MSPEPEEGFAPHRSGEGLSGPWWVVINPMAGPPRAVAERVRGALSTRGIEATLSIPGRAQELDEAVVRGIETGHRRFAAVGGDGTVHLVLNALLARPWTEPPVLGVLPTGSGCDFLRTFGIPQRLEDAARHLAGDGEYRADVGFLEGGWGRRHFLNVAQAGIGAASARVAGRLPRVLGRRKYPLAFWGVWPSFPRTVIELAAGRREYRGSALMVVFANGQFFGGGMNIAPRANLVDGEVDVQVFTGSKGEAVTLFPRVRRGLHLTARSVRRFSSSTFALSSERPWPVEADGEYLGTTPLSGGVLPGAIRIKI